jgi:DNA gyrase/topoisomerase IV subunit A
MPIGDIRVMGRKTQGVRLINLVEGDVIADIAVIQHEEGGQAPLMDRSEEE